MEPRSLKLLTSIVIVMVAIDSLGVLATAAAQQIAPGFVAGASDSIDLATALIKLTTMGLFIWWIVRAGSNLLAMGYGDLSFSPAARVWWFAIPFANLVQPYLGMRELWNASHGKARYDETVPIVAIWWGLYLANGFMAILFQAFVGGADTSMMWTQGVLDVALAIAAISCYLAFPAPRRRSAGRSSAKSSPDRQSKSPRSTRSEGPSFSR